MISQTGNLTHIPEENAATLIGPLGHLFKRAVICLNVPDGRLMFVGLSYLAHRKLLVKVVVE